MSQHLSKRVRERGIKKNYHYQCCSSCYIKFFEKINTFEAYGGAGDQRRSGANEASKMGAIGVIIRSLSSTENDYPHTGFKLRKIIKKRHAPYLLSCSSDLHYQEMCSAVRD